MPVQKRMRYSQQTKTPPHRQAALSWRGRGSGSLTYSAMHPKQGPGTPVEHVSKFKLLVSPVMAISDQRTLPQRGISIVYPVWRRNSVLPRSSCNLVFLGPDCPIGPV